MVIVNFLTTDYIASVVETTDSTNSFSLGSIAPSSALNRKSATVLVTHDSGLTLTARCLLGITNLSGGGK
jgi:hypothetical protein